MMSEVPPPAKVRFYTTGYRGKNINNLKPLLETLDAVLVDVRFSPTADSMFWREIYLKALVGKKYFHIVQLGNRESTTGKIQIQNLNLGLKILISLQINAVLMCECVDVKSCHRWNIARELSHQNYEIEELATWDVVNLP